MSPDATFLTEQEVADRLQCSVSRVRQLRERGELAYIRRRPILIEASDLAEYMRRYRPDLLSTGNIGDQLIDQEEIARRLKLRPDTVRHFLIRHRIRYERTPGLAVVTRELWDYLIEARHVRRSAFGPEPLHDEAEAAYTQAVERLVSDRLSYLEYEDERRARRLEAVVERTAQKAAAKKADRAAKRSKTSRGTK